MYIYIGVKRDGSIIESWRTNTQAMYIYIHIKSSYVPPVVIEVFYTIRSR